MPSTLRENRLSSCVICERPFAEPVSDEQARGEWEGASDDEIGYACGPCADREGYDS